MPRTAAAVVLVVLGVLVAASVLPATPLVLGICLAVVGAALLV